MKDEFARHLEETRRPDGSYDLAAAEKALAHELTSSTPNIKKLARQAATAARNAWESGNREHNKKLFAVTQPSLWSEEQLSALVPLGQNRVIELRHMKEVQIRTRMDLRTNKHLDENRAFDSEIQFWQNVLRLLPPGGSIGDIG